MTEKGKLLLEQALRLSEKERADLAAGLMESLEQEEDLDAEELWDMEILRRVEDVRKGRVQFLSWPEARRVILDDTDG